MLRPWKVAPFCGSPSVCLCRSGAFIWRRIRGQGPPPLPGSVASRPRHTAWRCCRFGSFIPPTDTHTRNSRQGRRPGSTRNRRGSNRPFPCTGICPQPAPSACRPPSLDPAWPCRVPGSSPASNPLVRRLRGRYPSLRRSVTLCKPSSPRGCPIPPSSLGRRPCSWLDGPDCMELRSFAHRLSRGAHVATYSSPLALLAPPAALSVVGAE